MSEYCKVCKYDTHISPFVDEYHRIGKTIGNIQGELSYHYRQVNEIQDIIELRLGDTGQCLSRLHAEKATIQLLEKELAYRQKPPTSTINGLKIDKALIDTIKDRTEHLNVMGQFVEITRPRGSKEYTFRCTKHGTADTTPSGHYDDEKKQWYCFGCSAGGDIFQFLKVYNNQDFIPAVKYLANLLGYSISNKNTH
jgi:hypothetical protein